jgi:hypothetical protein
MRRLFLALLLAPPLALVFTMLASALVVGFRDFSFGGAGYAFVAVMLVGGAFVYMAEAFIAIPVYLMLRAGSLRPPYSAAAAGAVAALVLSAAVILFGEARDRGHWEYLPPLLVGGAAAGTFVWATALRDRPLTRTS